MTMATVDIKKEAYEDALKQIVKDTDILSKVCNEASPAIAKPIIEHLKSVSQDIQGGGVQTCAGLAANQLGYTYRIFVLLMPNGKYKAFVNPRILGGGPKIDYEEGCFSFPGKSTKTKRHKWVLVKADNLTGSLKLTGLQDIAFQHELDHLNGISI